MKLLDILNWRYATKRMNGKKVSAEKLENILDAIRLSASSIGLRPYSVLVIENSALREKIQAIANNQPQITESSHLLVFAAWDNVTNERIGQYIRRVMQARKVTEESLATLKGYLTGLLNHSEEDNFRWTARQAYIALGTALVAAAAEQVDSTPMEGFNNAALDELLGLRELGLKSVVLLPLGYRDEATDWLLNLPKVRTEKEQLFITDEQLAVSV